LLASFSKNVQLFRCALFVGICSITILNTQLEEEKKNFAALPLWSFAFEPGQFAFGLNVLPLSGLIAL
jgi:hypothetical protein